MNSIEKAEEFFNNYCVAKNPIKEDREVWLDSFNHTDYIDFAVAYAASLRPLEVWDDEATMDFIREYVPNNPACTATYAQIHKMLTAFSQRLSSQGQDGWISVDERLPNHKVSVLTCDSYDGIITGYFNTKESQWYTLEGTTWEEVEKWQPLPPPPSQDKNEI